MIRMVDLRSRGAWKGSMRGAFPLANAATITPRRSPRVPRLPPLSRKAAVPRRRSAGYLTYRSPAWPRRAVSTPPPAARSSASAVASALRACGIGLFGAAASQAGKLRRPPGSGHDPRPCRSCSCSSRRR